MYKTQQQACTKLLSNAFQPWASSAAKYTLCLVMLAVKCTLCLNQLIFRATGGGQKWWDDRSSSVSFRENTFLSRTLTWTCTLVPHLVPAAPAAQCWTGTQYMLLMIQWICLQPSGVYTWSKHSHHAKINYRWSGAVRG